MRRSRKFYGKKGVKGGVTMRLRKYILDNKNIYLAIYAAKSYVFDSQLLDKEDKELLNSLADPFNEELISKTIQRVRKILENVLDDEKNEMFQTQVYFKPKDYIDNKVVYRPIHTAKLEQLIAMVAMLHPLIYEIPNEENQWKLKLSNYSRLIPNNFYGNRVSKRPERLFKNWSGQYKKYTQKANEHFKIYYDSREYKYELKLDMERFFPSINPLVLYGFFMKNIPVTLNDRDIEDFKKILYKLLVCEVTNLNTDLARYYYYGKKEIDINYTIGIAQGLPQAYFFGNICMKDIAEVFENIYPGKSVYYVDDSYIYTNKQIDNIEEFRKQLEIANEKIQIKTLDYIDEAKKDDYVISQKKYFDYCEMLGVTLETQTNQQNGPYRIKVHLEGKSTYTRIQEVKEGEVYLRTLSREASQIGTDINSTYSEEEEITLLNRTEALLKSIESELLKDLSNRKSYKEKLTRYYKFFKYRTIKLKLKTEDTLNRNIFEALLEDVSNISLDEGYKVLEQGISTESFFKKYKNDIWGVALSTLISNTIFEHEEIKKYIRHVIEQVYEEELLACSYIKKMYTDYLGSIEVKNAPDYYATLNKQTAKNMTCYSNMHSKVLKDKFNGVQLSGLENDILSSFAICSEKFIEISKVVNLNSNRLQRMFLNAVYSKVFKINLGEDIVLSSYDKKGITYGELRTIVYLRNVSFNVKKFLKWDMDLMSGDNMQKVDYTIFEVLDAYKKYVKYPECIDKLILTHKYTYDVWRNGAKHLYFYTLHNQEHAVDLIKNIIKIIKNFSYLKISSYDYYIVFIACYLHDISMVKIASEKDFLLDSDDSEQIVMNLDKKWEDSKDTSQVKATIFEAYKEVDSFYENKIRSKHSKDSADEIRTRNELGFLESSVRECVAEIAEGHGIDVKDVYFSKGDAKGRLVSYKFNKILLRFADLLDMSRYRISKPILNHNLENMSLDSAFHWVSHLLTEGYELTSEYTTANGNESDNTEYLAPGKITEKVILSIYVNLSQLSKLEAGKCKCVKIIESKISGNGFELELTKNNEVCKSKKCNFLCKWFNEKNFFLVQEMQALESYLQRVPKAERFYNTSITIKVIISNSTDIKDEEFEILKRKIT